MPASYGTLEFSSYVEGAVHNLRNHLFLGNEVDPCSSFALLRLYKKGASFTSYIDPIYRFPGTRKARLAGLCGRDHREHFKYEILL